MEWLSFAGLDAATGFLLAAAAALRARQGANQPAGACVIGVLCGVCAPLLRHAILGYGVAALNSPGLGAAVFAGALVGPLLDRAPRIGETAFILLDAAGMCLAAAAAAVWAGGMGVGIAGRLVLAVICGLLPGILRDVTLGDMAQLAGERFHAVAPVLAAIPALALAETGFPPEICVCAGCLCGFLPRAVLALKGL